MNEAERRQQVAAYKRERTEAESVLASLRVRLGGELPQTEEIFVKSRIVELEQTVSAVDAQLEILEPKARPRASK